MRKDSIIRIKKRLNDENRDQSADVGSRHEKAVTTLVIDVRTVNLRINAE